MKSEQPVCFMCMHVITYMSVCLKCVLLVPAGQAVWLDTGALAQEKRRVPPAHAEER